MESVGKILQNSFRETNTPHPTSSEPQESYSEEEPTLEERREQLRKSLRLSSLENTFENFKPVKGTGKALAAFKMIAELNSDLKMLLCYGGVGNGKTYLAEATSIALYKQGIRCGVMTMAELMRQLKASLKDNAIPPYDILFNRLAYRDYLILDDVGMGGSGSEWEYGQLEEIVVIRYREKLFTILTTNRDLSELPERVTSRFFDPDVGMVVFNEGSDFRRLKLKGRN